MNEEPAARDPIAEDARIDALDERLKRVWERHPGFHYIPTEPSFMRKLNRGLEAIGRTMEMMRSAGHA